ncbi:MAG: YggS family pyridoxal phosphate-dependent enzyme [Gammaproteobacteria bacterium]|nr:YggS family pyridoxal phosphate-dependent enzyme [Gammaproteobacteria bacterium]
MSSDQSVIKQRYRKLVADIAAAARQSGRNPDEILLLGASKQQPAAAIRVLAGLGLRDFGENYVQDALDKQSELEDLALTWHFIGRIQSNKTRDIARHFHWVHGVDRVKIARRLSEQRDAPEPLNLCLQVNIDDEPGKGGLEPGELLDAAQIVSGLPNIRLRGLMAIPRPEADPVRQRAAFRRVRELFQQLRGRDPALDTLSMGMTADLAAAIAEGATIVRIGTALFGQRPG